MEDSKAYTILSEPSSDGDGRYGCRGHHSIKSTLKGHHLTTHVLFSPAICALSATCHLKSSMVEQLLSECFEKWFPWFPFPRPEVDSEWTSLRVPVQTNSMVLRGLSPDTLYQFMVQAVNSNGASDPSSINGIWTLSEYLSYMTAHYKI